MPLGFLAALFVLVAQALMAALMYSTQAQALESNDAIVLLVVSPAVGLSFSLLLLMSAQKLHKVASGAGSPEPVSAAWVLGSLVGLAGFVLGYLAGPHIGAAASVWFLVLQLATFGVSFLLQRRKHFRQSPE
jgi:ABC-type Mn2+/Zn2+ transport system permease subunit